ncbi:Choline-sulfatase [Planctomycetes bacterium CA13]|uniref:Choline-sulfatase n=1 Tax=Novipirellula herctigrandis TaxID=2527986 RepID=A0A5C5Z0W3_9BACT|nr:Choline-sulfatase [Planctomycetes bacterium CA13]
MNFKRAIVGLLAVVSSSVSAFSFDETETATIEKPNLVFIIADDCTFRDMSVYGGQAHTPNIEKLASEGIKFERCFQAAPMCSPTRHNIYTGLYPVKSGAYPNHTHANPGVKSIVQYLKPLGYRVALSGKTHIGPREQFPFEYSSNQNNPDMNVIDTLFAESVENKKPFCLFACSNEPHSPWNKGDASVYPPESINLPPYIVDTPNVRQNFSRYLAEITYYDSQVGEIVAMLEKHGLANNTLLMVVSEQGNSFPFAKWTCYDNGLQSAMIVRWPGKVKPGTVTDAMVEYVDVTPTFIDAAGGEPIDGLDGKSFSAVLKGKTDRHKEFTYGIMTTRGIINGSDAYAIRSVRGQKYKLIKNLNHESKFTNAYTKSADFQSMVAKADAGDATARKLVNAYQQRPAIEFYDVQEDPLEMNNLADNPEFAQVIMGLSKKLDEWMIDQGDEGVATELRAFDHQRKGKNAKNKKTPSKQAQRKQKTKKLNQ